MDYFSDFAITKDVDGNVIFYRWGYFSKYYILPTQQKVAEIRSFMNRYLLISAGAVAFIGFIWGVPYSLLVLPISLVWYQVETSYRLQGLKTRSNQL